MNKSETNQKNICPGICPVIVFVIENANTHLPILRFLKLTNKNIIISLKPKYLTFSMTKIITQLQEQKKHLVYYMYVFINLFDMIRHGARNNCNILIALSFHLIKSQKYFHDKHPHVTVIFYFQLNIKNACFRNGHL